ncbi:hypothetical protein [Roseateles sp. BYS96W]|uniref:Uncharacterized protein n=1 Tax=Pelomonas nitida TaxID=3299027 RepID=A0ABW7GBD7_9BURK
MNQEQDSPWAYRLGAATLGAMAGLALGLLLGSLAVAAGAATPLAHFAGAGSLAGVASGLLAPAGAMDFFFGTLHFFIGFFATVLDRVDDDTPSRLYGHAAGREGWPRWAFIFGIAFALFLTLL